MKTTNLYIQKNIFHEGTWGIDNIKLLNDLPKRSTKEYEFGKWYPVGEFTYGEDGTVNVEIKGDKVRLVSFNVPVKFPSLAKGYTGPIVKYGEGDNQWTCNV